MKHKFKNKSPIPKICLFGLAHLWTTDLGLFLSFVSTCNKHVKDSLDVFFGILCPLLLSQTSQVYSPLSFPSTSEIFMEWPSLVKRESRRTLMSPAKMILLPCNKEEFRVNDTVLKLIKLFSQNCTVSSSSFFLILPVSTVRQDLPD